MDEGNGKLIKNLNERLDSHDRVHALMQEEFRKLEIVAQSRHRRRRVTSEDFTIADSLGLNKFDRRELVWSLEIARRHANAAIEAGASAACVEFWRQLACIFLEEIESRERPQ